MTTLIIGGGVVGLSIAFGMLQQGKSIVVLDGGDGDFRASRGNFGLVWVQGKGIDCPAYSNWSRQSAELWPKYAKELKTASGIDVCLRQQGGVDYFTNEDDLTAHVRDLEGLRDAVGGDYPFDVLDHEGLKKLVPQIGPKVVGGLYSPMDGDVNPLLLLKALTIGVQNLGGDIRSGDKVVEIIGADHAFTAVLENGDRIEGSDIVLAAGLGAAALGVMLGFKALVRPQQGQVLITEKLPFFLEYPSDTLRQVNEGGVQIGATKAEIGHDDREDLATLAKLARHAVEIFPHLAKAKLVRSWAALRVMSPDGLPIYQRSARYKGACFVTCHSGITLAAAHAALLPDWVMGTNKAPDLSEFSEARF